MFKLGNFLAESELNWNDTFFKVKCSMTISNKEVPTFRKEYIFKWSFLQNTLDCRQSHGIESLRINWKCRQSSHWQKFQIQLWAKNHSSLHGQEGKETRNIWKKSITLWEDKLEQRGIHLNFFPSPCQPPGKRNIIKVERVLQEQRSPISSNI